MANVKNKNLKNVVINGKKLRKLRQKKGWTIEEMEVVSGVNRGTIAGIETNARAYPTVAVLYKITQAIDIKMEDVVEEVE